MYDVIREWPRYVKVPFPIAKVNRQTVNIIGPMETNLFESSVFSATDKLILASVTSDGWVYLPLENLV